MALVAVGLFFWHRKAVAYLSSSFLTRASGFAEEEKFANAAQEVWRYLKIQPNDPSAKRKLADYHYESVQRTAHLHRLSRSVEFQQQAINVSDGSDVDELRNGLVELQFSLGRDREAIKEASQLFDQES